MTTTSEFTGLDDELNFGATAFESHAASGDSEIDGLLSGYRWSNTDITFSFTDDLDEDYDHGQAGYLDAFEWSALSSAQEEAVYYWASQASAVSGLEFMELDGENGELDSDAEATIRISNSGDAGDGAYAWGLNAFSVTVSSGMSPLAGDVFFGGLGADPSFGNFDQTVVAQEFGHALGLGDPEINTDGFGTTSGAGATQFWTVMGYDLSFDNDDPNITEDFYEDLEPLEIYDELLAGSFYEGSTQTYMRGDIAALQYLYGANYDYNSGDTTYTVDLTTGEFFVDGVSQGDPDGNVIHRTLWDGGGDDTFDLTNLSTDLNVDLNAGAVIDLDVGGYDNRAFTGDTMDLYHLDEWTWSDGHIWMSELYEGNGASLIENVFAGSGDDVLTGNGVGNDIRGGLGNDTIYGDGGWDELYGGDGNDTIDGGKGSDNIFGGSGNDTIYGGNHSDTIYGGVDDDTIDGGNHSDYIQGGGGNDVVRGGHGDDTLEGGSGSDIFEWIGDGSEGHDTVLDFEVGVDLIELDASLASTTTLTTSGGDAVLSWNGGDNSVVLEDVAGSFTFDDISFV